MSFKQFLPIPIGIAFLAAALMVIDLAKPPFLLTWITFQAWAMYFLAGCTLQGAAKVMLGYLGGALASMAIILLAGVFAPLGQLGLPLAVFIVVIFVICAERVPWFDFVPSWFVGAGVFFGLVTHFTFPEGTTLAGKFGLSTAYLMVSCLVGMVFGYITVQGRGRYEASLATD